MLAYQIIVTLLDASMMFLMLIMKKETDVMAITALFMIIIFAMNLGLVWN